MQKFYSRSKWSEPYIGLPRPGVLDQEDKAPDTWLWRPEGLLLGFPGGTGGEEPTCQCRRCGRCSFTPWVGKILWRWAWWPAPVFLPGESHEQRSLVGMRSQSIRHNWRDLVHIHAGLTFGSPRQLAVRSPDYTLKNTHKNLSCYKTKGRHSNLKGVWVRPTYWSWTPKEERGNWTHSVDPGTGGSHFGELFYHRDIDAGKCYF